MRRRQFILGAVAAAVSAALPASDGVALNSMAHPVLTEDMIESGFGLAPLKVEGASIAYDLNEANLEKISIRYANALARSMMQTREHVAANVLNNIFPEYEHRTFHTGTLEELVSGEGARRSVGVEGSPDRI